MYKQETLNDIRNLERFLQNDTSRLNKSISQQLEEEDDKKKLSSILKWSYSVGEDEKSGKMMYSRRDFTKAPVIDKTKKEVTFETKEGITETFTYDIDDTQEKVE